MRYIPIIVSACFLSAIGFCQSSLNTSDCNAADAQKSKARWHEALELQGTGKYKEACEKWSRIIELEPNSYKAYYERSSCFASWASRIKDDELLTKAHDDYEKLKALSLAYKDNPAIRKWQADAGINLTSSYSQAGKTEDVCSIYNQLTLLAGNHPDEATLRESQAAAGTNLILAYAKVNRPDDACLIYGKLKSLAEKYSDEPAL